MLESRTKKLTSIYKNMDVLRQNQWTQGDWIFCSIHQVNDVDIHGLKNAVIEIGPRMHLASYCALERSTKVFHKKGPGCPDQTIKEYVVCKM